MFVILRCLRIFQSSSVRGTEAVSSFPSTPYLFPSLLPFNSLMPSLSASLKKEAQIVMVTLRSHAAKQQDPWDSDPAALQ